MQPDVEGDEPICERRSEGLPEGTIMDRQAIKAALRASIVVYSTPIEPILSSPIHGHPASPEAPQRLRLEGMGAAHGARANKWPRS